MTNDISPPAAGPLLDHIGTREERDLLMSRCYMRLKMIGAIADMALQGADETDPAANFEWLRGALEDVQRHVRDIENGTFSYEMEGKQLAFFTDLVERAEACRILGVSNDDEDFFIDLSNDGPPLQYPLRWSRTRIRTWKVSPWFRRYRKQRRSAKSGKRGQS
ncbi:hypothetical protein [Paraburkholderia silvatlantica]|uniref:hypothetical protein n=1 Tax=Paraburkholderia silvatlantica TaxID=321895 RepID=UPI00375066D9